jgi:MoxR-like ATPase
MKVDKIKQRCDGVLDVLSQIVVGKDRILRQVLAGILANGHILLEDYPGLAKTLIARLFSQALELRFSRIQFTPDLLPGDITGSSIYDQREGRFEFRRGPIFAHLVLADEINRATPKTQSALLEAMQERQVTIEGQSHPLDPPFLVIATQNPIELEGTYPLPEAQLDRFLVRISVGYPERQEEKEVLRRRRERRRDLADVPRVVPHDVLLAMQAALEDVHVDDAIDEYIVDLVRATRVDDRVALGVSPRGALALQGIARAEAALHGRDFVTPDDVKAMAVPVLAHRIVLRPELWMARLSPVEVVEEILRRVPTPKVEAARS